MGWYDIITQQNYFSNNGEILIQEDGLAMEAPTSGLLAEFFLQHLEHIQITHILIIYDANHTDVHNNLHDFNTIHPQLKFTAQQETAS
jgi:hypothetical protein